MGNKIGLISLLMGSVLLLSGCGDGGGSSNEGASGAALTGTAATGAAISGGTISVKCADNGSYPTATTNSAGSYSIPGIPSTAFPCALEISYGTTNTLHSYANGNGTVNITPLTDLALALATTQMPAAWFAGFTGTAITNLTAQADALLAQLKASGYAIPPSGSPFSTTFTANQAGWDKVLDQLQAAINASATLENYEALLAVIKDGNLGSMPTAPIENDGDTGDTGGTGDTGDTGGTGDAGSGDGAALNGQDGATATIDGTTYTYTKNVGWDQGLGVFSAYGAIATDPEKFDALSYWKLGGLQGVTAGSYVCNETVALGFGKPGNYPTFATSCNIDITEVTANSISGHFSATFSPAANVGTAAEQGYFHYQKYHEEAPSEDLQADEFGYSLKADGVLEKDTTVNPLDGWDLGPEQQVNLGTKREVTYSGHSYHMSTIPGKTSGTYACGDNSPYRTIVLTYSLERVTGEINGVEYRSNREDYPGACTITVNYANGIYSGTFSGTLYNKAGDKIEISEGKFRNDGRNLP